ncbi:MAG: D-aminoacyl-tRNA deacylase [Dehalococcoidales bacterium]
MKALLQRVNTAAVTVDGEVVGKIGHGLVVFIGVAGDDSTEDIQYLVNKIPQLRIFDDAGGKFNLSALDVKGELLLVSQFTLLAGTRKGRRPGFTDAAPPEIAENLFNQFVEQTRKTGLKVETGRFQTHMHVAIDNDGPVTIFIDSRERLTSRSS